MIPFSLDATETKLYRGVVARCNYLAQDRVDIQDSCKECSRQMARPRQGDGAVLKRIGRSQGIPKVDPVVPLATAANIC